MKYAMNLAHTILVCIAAFSGVLVSTAFAQEARPKAPYTIPKPKNWNSERIALPPGFAPKMSWKGHEDLRFAPGMFAANKPDFFTYYVLFWLPDRSEQKIQVSSESLKQELRVYYQGLSETVLKSRNPDATASEVKVRIDKDAKDKDGKNKDAKRAAGESAEPKTFRGELEWTEPFATGKPQTLRFEAEVGRSGKNTYLKLLVSPSKDEAVWASLRKLSATTEFLEESP